MRNVKAKMAALTLAAAMLLTACSDNEGANSSDSKRKKDESSYSSNTGAGDSGNTGIGNSENLPPEEPVKQLGMWDVLPEIPVTDASAFKYEYDSKLGGMVVTDYLRESPKVRIPDKIEGEAVVGIDLSECKKQLTELIMPDSVISYKLSGKIKGSLQYGNVPRSSKGMSFSSCSSLISVFIPDSVTKIDEECFEECENVSVTFKNKSYDYKSIGALYDTINLGENYMLIEDGVLKKASRAFTKCAIPDSVTKIDARTFSGYYSLTSVNIPGSVTEIGAYAFAGCDNLTDVVINEGVVSIGGCAFQYCPNLTSVTLPNSLTNNEGFYNCPNAVFTYKGKTYDYEHLYLLNDAVEFGGQDLIIEDGVLKDVSREATKVTIPDSVTEIASGAFDGCENIVATYKGKTYDYENIDMLYDVFNLGGQDLIIEDGVLKDVSRALTKVTIPNSVTEIGKSAFSGCKRLTSVTIPNSVTEIGEYAFYDCTSLTSVTIPDSVTEIGKNAFSGCTSLTSVTILDGVIKIGSCAFYNCKNLTNLIIPDSVTEIGTDALAGSEDYTDPSGGSGVHFYTCYSEKIQVSYKGKTYDSEHIEDLYNAINYGY